MSNKYQEALSKLEAIICELSCELKEDYELYTRDTGYEEHIETLQELVDKATPMKVGKTQPLFLEEDLERKEELEKENQELKAKNEFEKTLSNNQCLVVLKLTNENKELKEVIHLLTYLNAIRPLEEINHQDGVTLYKMHGNYLCKEQAELLKKHLNLRKNVINT